MKQGHTIQGISSGVGTKIWAISNLMSDRKIERNAKCLAGVVNPAASGIWDANQNFNEGRFIDLTKNAVRNSEGTLVITESIFKEFVINLHKGVCTGNATKLGYLIPVSWYLVTDGSISELIKYYSDTTYESEGKNGKSEKAMSVEKMRQFYTDPNSVMQERIVNLDK